ncbi:RHS repeat domain-containing protein [Pseudomonas mandelii]|uniref:RHS repeat domain-containing protein n=1 Tax=Pseudomonas mandelii TaxID=75612 RepID=UPI0020A1288D|nr:RHS repeat-associated core domain-containing protein [Pseudomonas mandelii]MCO8312372.1 RHS repeat-associated core domain-containing protein [Pseudomonas mandelii]
MSASVHFRTPSMAVNGPRGSTIRQVNYLRTVAGGEVEALITRQHYDLAGRLVAQQDPRLSTSNSVTVYSLEGHTLKLHNVDAGTGISLPGLAGKSVQTWDPRNNHRRMNYDNQMRVVAIEVNAVPDIETFGYANAGADPGHNLRGQMTEREDSSGRVNFLSYALPGPSLGETRTFHDGKAFTSHQVFSPLGRVLEHTNAGGHQQRSTYDIAGQLIQVQLKLNGQPDWQPVLRDAQYNAAGQIIEKLTGNGVTSHWHYHPADGRLHRQSAQKASGPALQDFEYEHDRMGNITCLLDHTYTPTHFANQRVDGRRTFVYDSLERLIRAIGYDDAPPKDNPGRPQPTDPKDRRNYTQTYQYDRGSNLIQLSHVRDGATQTRQMVIAPDSNRGVRWKPADPDPDFPALFDRAGNLLALQPGQPIRWNDQNQLESVTLAEHASGPHDIEQSRYSQGARVYKRHETHTTKISHFHEVRYLPGLEIHTKDNGEELHVISVGNARCLHWEQKKPDGIASDQLRYSLEDHLGSCVTELDQQAQLISHEGYYPFGATAWMVARSAIEVSYKFIRYSGKEMDVSGLYYYGARYYAPWLQRWISADPAGDVDGLNLYGFVGNNPLRYVDASGESELEAAIMLSSAFISKVGEFAEQTNLIMHNVINKKHLKRNLAANLVVETIKGPIGYEAGVIAGGMVDRILPSIPGIPYLTAGGLIGGNIAGDVTGAMVDPLINTVADSLGVTIGPLIPQTSTMSVAKINSELGITSDKEFRLNPLLDKVLNPEFMMNRVISSWLSIIPGTLNMFARAIEVEDIINGLDPVKVGKIEMMYTEWQQAVQQHSAIYEEAFKELGTNVLEPSVAGGTAISLDTLRAQTLAAQAEIRVGLRGIAAYKEMNTTDNRFLRQQEHPVQKKHSRFYNWFTRDKQYGN